jgi:hypothetical protein
MCLENRLEGKEKADAIAALRKTFPVWKYCPTGAESQNRVDSKEPRFTKNRRMKAGVFPGIRRELPYAPGFHAFLAYRAARKIYGRIGDLRKFEVRREDVMEIGKFNGNYGKLKGVVLSHIKPV